MSREDTAIDGEIVDKQPSQIAIVPDRQAVMATPKQLRAQMTRAKEIREIIDEYIKNNMVVDKDYGSIVIGGKKSKPSLFKPGAEKFCELFKLRPVFRKDTETLDMLGNTPGLIAYLCELIDTQGRVVGEGRGTSSVDPNGKDFDINKAVKIAEKRAQIDAVLRTGGLSDFFTQDMEDMPKEAIPKGLPTAEAHTSNKTQYASQKQIDLIMKLASERFESSEAYRQFAAETVGVVQDFTVKQASRLIAELFKKPVMQEKGDV